MSPASAVYILCFATSAVCAGLLIRAWGRSRAPLLFWSALSFVFLALNNALLVADMVVFLNIDFRIWRTSTALAAAAVMIYGFIWRGER
jgi:hypothetical protein